MSDKVREILRKKRLGEILKSLDFIDEKKLSEILEKQKDSNMKLGEVLTSMGYVDQEVILAIVGKQLGHPYIKISDYGKIPREIISLIPDTIARKHMLIPFALEDGVLKIAMTDPQEDEVRASIAVLTDTDVESYITSIEEINSALDRYY